jgi:hypothetical protein
MRVNGSFSAPVCSIPYRQGVRGDCNAAACVYRYCLVGGRAFGMRLSFFGIRSGRFDRRHDRKDRQVAIGRRRREVAGAARQIQGDTPRLRRSQTGGAFGTGGRHVGRIGHAALPSVVDAHGFRQQWRDQRRRRLRAGFARWRRQGKRSRPWIQIHFHRPLSRRTGVGDAGRSEQLPGRMDGDEVMIWAAPDTILPRRTGPSDGRAV